MNSAKRLLIALLALCGVARAQFVPAPILDKTTHFQQASIVPFGPQLIQYHAVTANPAGFGQPSANDYKQNFAPTGAGDTLIVGVTGLHGSALTLTDSAGDSSPTAICSADDGSTNGLSYVFAFQPSTGVTWVELAASATFAQPTHFVVAEFNNIASVTSQGTECQAGLSTNGGVVTPTSFTPTNNNSTGGNLIFNYTALATGTNTPNCNASGYGPATGFTLLNGDVNAWINGDGFGFPASAQYEIQTTAAPIIASVVIPGETCSSGGGDAFNSLTIALKIGSAGISNPTTIHVVRAFQLTTSTQGGPTLPKTFVIPTPTQGNLRVFMFEAVNTGSYIQSTTTVTFSDGCPTHLVTVSTFEAFIVYAQDCSPCPTCYAVFANSGGGTFGNTGGKFYDIENANASSYQNETDDSLSCSSETSVTDAPSITPATSAGLTLVMLSLGQGPTTGLTAPSGAIYGCATWSGQTDGDLMCFGDGHGWYYFSSNAQQNFTWGITSIASDTCNVAAAVFK